MTSTRDLVEDGERADTRATAVLAVLAGGARGVVAERYGVDTTVLDGWVSAFLTAGRAALAQGSTDDPEADPAPHRHLGLVAHELRSPLAMIKGWAELLRHEGGSGTVERATTGILAQTDRMIRLADDAVNATRVALGTMPLDTRVQSLADAVATIVTARPIETPLLAVTDDALVRLDVDRFGQVLDNLLENSRKHATGTATITVSTRDDVAEIVISTPGRPIPRELAERMFEPFERGQTEGEGMGLGLYVCRSLIAAHGGQIGITANEDGNHFWIRMPVVAEPLPLAYVSTVSEKVLPEDALAG